MTQISQFSKYEGYSEALYNGHQRRSDYLALADGTKLAYDLLLPTRRGVPAADALPVLLLHTPYLRAMKLVEQGKVLLDELFDLGWLTRTVLRLRARLAKGDQIGDITSREGWLKRLLLHGYAVVVVERSGTGASSGGISASFHEVAQEADQILDWIAAQPWCAGNIGMAGTSMVAMAQYAAASAGNPHLKAILPCASSLDLYGSLIYPGGVYCSGFARVLSGSTSTLERMIVPVDSDPEGTELAEILRARAEWTLGEVTARGSRQAPYRDSRSPHPRGDRLWEDQGLYNLLDEINRSGVAVYNSAGWLDLFARDSLLWHANLRTPHRLHVRPVFHTRMGKSGRDLDFAAEAHRWFDYWLKGIDNGIMDEPPIRYFVMGGSKFDPWLTAHQWPLPDEQRMRFYLSAGRTGSVASANDGFLHLRAPQEPEGADACAVDYTTTSGPRTRWSAVLEPAAYPSLRARDERALTYTTPLLDSDVEVTGHPVVHLWIASDAPDLDLFAYLEEVDPGGRAMYVTEGNLRASHRALNEAPFDNLGLPYHRSYAEDMAPLPPDAPVELVFDLLPTSKRFRQGHRIRLAVTGADADNFETPLLEPPPELRLLRNAAHASFVELPVITQA